MGCCGGKRSKPKLKTRDRYDIMGGYKYLQPHQVRARLEAFKKRFCQGCEKRYECDFKMYQQCQKYRIDGGR